MFGFTKSSQTPVRGTVADQRRLPWQYLGAEGYDDETGLFYCVSPSGERHLGATFMTTPLLGGGGSVFEKFKAALACPLPAGSFVQVGLLGSPDIDPYLDAYTDGKEQASGLLEKLVRARVKMFQDAVHKPQFKTNGVLNRDFRLIFTVKIPCSHLPDLEERQSIRSDVTRVMEGFSSIGFQFRMLDPHGYLHLIRKFYHMWEKPEFSYDELIPIREQAFYPGDDVEFKEREILFHQGSDQEFFVRVMSPKLFPKRTVFGVANLLIGDQMGGANQITEPFFFQFTAHYPDQVKKKGEVRQRHMWITQQCIGNSANWFPILGYKKEGIETFIHEIDGQGGMALEVNLSLMIFSKNRDRLARQTASLNSYLSTLSFDMREDKRILDFLWHNALPMNASADALTRTFRTNTMSARQAAPLVPLFADYKGSGANATSLFVTRRGQVSAFSVWDSNTGYNVVVFAGTGGGKSFLAQLLIVDNLAEGCKVWVIDVGKSFFKLNRALKGDYIEFSEESQIILNPFTFVSEIDEDIDIIKATIAKMAAPEGGLDDYQMAALEEGIKATWDRYAHNSTVTAVAQWCMQQPDPRVRDLGQQLYPFTVSGSYGRWFEGEATIDVSNRFTVLDLLHLKSRPILQKVVLLQLMNRIATEMYTTPGRKILILDEAWELMDDPLMAKAIEALYRKVRKNSGAVVFITQGVGDLFQSPNGRAIYANSAWQIVLEQRAESVDAAVASGQFSMDAFGVHQVKSLHVVPGEYSELMIKRSDSDYGIVRFRPDPFMFTLFASNGEERDEAIAAIEQGADPEKVIDFYTQKRLEKGN